MKRSVLMAIALPWAAAAEGLPIRDYLRTARVDEAFRTHQEKARQMGPAPFDMPLIEDAEVRIRNDAFRFDSQRYTLRLQPKGIGEGGATRRYYRAQTEHIEQRGRLLENRALKDRYLAVIAFWEQQAKERNLQELVTLYEDRIKVLEARKGSADFDLVDLIEAENELTKLAGQRMDIEKEGALLRNAISRHLGGAPFQGFDTAGAAPADSVVAWLDREGLSIDTNNAQLRSLRAEVGMAEDRHRLETAETRRYLSFLEFSYDQGRRLDELDRRSEGKDYELERAYIVEVGFRIPPFAWGGSGLRRRQEAFLSEREDYRRLERELREGMAKDLADIKTLIARYRHLRARETEVAAEASLKKYQKAGASPLALLAIRESSLKNSLNAQEVRFAILRNYIRVLDAGGLLSRPPLRNLLSARPEALAP